eukprot:CAMPEP_0194316790 /NCGR_PEP_ID=MMETSP0171-20130528/13557_1 /TAXON_ID=218684 /ORGANISM="Corethron pennatum, Strain L29A3" /LENGTH=42 /DNA_ID= /DNA_START= /DNA_END= /DNA_ORIENTATION=
MRILNLLENHMNARGRNQWNNVDFLGALKNFFFSSPLVANLA